MIYLYTGTPGSGKSYHATATIINKLKRKKKKGVNMSRVISNYVVNYKSDDFFLVDNFDLTVDYLKDFAMKYHMVGVENQTLVVLDEAQILFNSRNWNSNSKERMNWLTFFSQHRHYGFNFILITQGDFMIDKQIRGLVEYEIAHLKMNNFFSWLPLKAFLSIERWYGQKMKVGHEIIFMKKRICNYYNSFVTFKRFDECNVEVTTTVAPSNNIK